jgi:inorganic pyrophosphatase
VREWLGRRVHVVVDRPLGSRHPDDPQAVYELNYGYVPGTIAGDGEPIDVYVIDSDQPLAECDAEVIAILRRRDDDEDKLVARVGNDRFTVEEIRQRTWFQERWFDTVVECE